MSTNWLHNLTCADDLGDRQERLPRQWRGRIDVGTPAVGEEERARSGAAILREPLGIGQRQNRADRTDRPLVAAIIPRIRHR